MERKDKCILEPGANAAMYDNPNEARREFWRNGRQVLMITKELPEDAPEYLGKMIETFRAPVAALIPWESGRVLGDSSHLGIGHPALKAERDD